MGDELVNFNVDYVAFGLAGGTFEVRDVSDAYLEALQMSLDNHLPVPLPDRHWATMPGRLFATGFSISEDTLDASVFGSMKRAWLSTGRSVSVTFHAEP
jgi:hypothetical protein